MQRRLIRPNLSEVKEKMTREARKKLPPPSDTHAENYYFLKQMNKRTLMAVALADGEQVEGYIEWYDRNCFKLNREGAPNLLIYKRQVKYLYKLSDQNGKQKITEKTEEAEKKEKIQNSGSKKNK